MLRRIHAVRRAVRLADARPNDGRCGNVVSALSAEFGWAGENGYLQLLDGTVSWVHCWNRLPDGTIVDATADQYQELWLGNVVALPPDDPLAGHYLNAPGTWSLVFERSAEGLGVVCTSGDRVRTVRSSLPRPWVSLARDVLLVVTGWELPDELVEVAARALRAKASTGSEWSSEELVHVLLIWGIQQSGSRGGGRLPWIATEFLEPL
ncbi:hypothetical protein GCM10027569_05140 [Flindersiella endophytica]